jgi:predicted secreted Zn-dependent protease
MDQLGHTDESGHHWDAYTEWYVNWSYPYSTTRDNCTTGPVKVQVKITFTFPQWNAPENTPQDLIDKWDAYLSALQIHEDGHKQIAILAGYEILQAMNALSAYPSCTELEQAADTIGEDVLEQHRQQEAIYDQNTEHGVTQGVHFP